MALPEALLLEPANFNIWIAARTDRAAGSGTASAPYNGAAQKRPPIRVTLTNVSQEATVDTGPVPHHLLDGDVVTIAGVTGEAAITWNGTFGIYGVTEFSFKYFMRKSPTALAEGDSTATGLTILFDRLLREIPPHCRIQLGPGVFLTRGFAPNDNRGWQPKTGQKIVGAGVDVTTLQLVGAENSDQHYHVIGMPVEPSGTTTVDPLAHFEVSDLTIDCNLDNQPGRPDPGYANVACGAVRVFGNHCRVSRTKAIHWGTKNSSKRCFVFAVITAASAPSYSETYNVGIEDCIATDPGSTAQPVAVFHAGGKEDLLPDSREAFGTAPFIRNCFIDAGVVTPSPTGNVRALSMGWCRGGVVEGNHVLNVDIGGPYQDRGSTRDLVVRNNVY